MEAESDTATDAPRHALSAYPEPNGLSQSEPRSHLPTSIEEDPATVASSQEFAHESPEMPGRDIVGHFGADIENFCPNYPLHPEIQVQNPERDPHEWDEMGKNGTPGGNFCPSSPIDSGNPALQSQPGTDDADSETTYPELLQGLLEFLGSSEGESEAADQKISPLTARQLSALPYLAAFPNVQNAARAAGIGRSTLYRWLEDDDFRSELARIRRESAEFARQELKGTMLRAVDVIRDAMNDESVEVRLRAARYSMAFSSQIDLAEKLKKDIDHLQLAVDEWKSKRPII